jgi:tRNA(Leu) C34 or U34 (ribose-2'-O)-methylase TrmL
MKGYNSVQLIYSDKPFDLFPANTATTCIEILDSTQPLAGFVYPDDPAVYVFGQEDGSVPAVARRHCHHFVQIIESFHCLNLASAVAITLYVRRRVMSQRGWESMPELSEARG